MLATVNMCKGRGDLLVRDVGFICNHDNASSCCRMYRSARGWLSLNSTCFLLDIVTICWCRFPCENRQFNLSSLLFFTALAQLALSERLYAACENS